MTPNYIVELVTEAMPVAGICTGRFMTNQVVISHPDHALWPVRHLLRPSACAAGCPQMRSPHMFGRQARLLEY